MEPHSISARMETLLDHTRWVQELARTMVGDVHVADDLAQEAVLAALKRQGDPPRSMRAWLAAVLRNLVWERVRSEGRRSARETSVAREERTPSTVELVERMSVHRELVEQVMGLPEHYREVLLRRYFEGETPTEIAGRLGAPVSTIKTRLSRALDAMRERMDDRHGGDGKGWMLAMAPLLSAPEGLAPAAPTTSAVPVAESSVGASLPWAVAGLLVFGGVAFWLGGHLLDGERGAARGDIARAPHASSDADADVVPESAVDEEPRREVADETRESEEFDVHAAATALDPENGRLPGRVLSIDGRPQPGMLVRFEPARRQANAAASGVSVAIADAEGRFEMTGVRGAGWVRAMRDGFVTVLNGASTGKNEVTLVVAPSRSVAGRVVDDGGRALAEVQLEWTIPNDLRTRFDESLAHASNVPFRTTSDAEGGFGFEVPALEGAELVVESEGYETERLAGAEITPAELLVTLRRPGMRAGMLRGVVLDDAGRALDGARVSTGAQVVRTDEQGEFWIDVNAPNAWGEPPHKVFALVPGLRPAEYEPEAEAGTGKPLWPDQVTLRLASPLSIRGRVVDDALRPKKSVYVWLADATVFRDPSDPLREPSETTTYGQEELPPGSPEVAESLASGRGNRPGSYVQTDADGTFVLEGLFDREYTIAALDPSSLVRVERSGVAAGSEDVVLTLDRSELLPRITGRVVSRTGEPVAAVRVRVVRPGLEVATPTRALTSRHFSRGGMRTGPDGVFWLHDVPRKDIRLRFEGAGVAMTLFGGTEAELAEMARSSEESSSPFDVVVELRVQVQVVLHDPSEADEIRFVDADGESVGLERPQGRTRVFAERIALSNGRSEVFSASDDAVRVELFSEGVLVRGLPVELRPGEVNRLQL